MILVRSPLRITLGGGGTDLPSYASRYGGYCLTAAITQYVYVSVLRPFRPGIYLKYSREERVSTIAEIDHPIIREALSDLLPLPPQIECTTLADIPAGTGLGSSSAFTTALLRGLHHHLGKEAVGPDILAWLAYRIEAERLQESMGPQDAYATAHGGLLEHRYPREGTPQIRRFVLDAAFQRDLETHLLLYFTGFTRAAQTLLSHQAAATIADDTSMIANLECTKAIGLESATALQRGDLAQFGRLLHTHWQTKRRRSPGMTTDQIDAWYELARNHGAIGGKLVGAGGGGCFLFCTEDPRALRKGLQESGLEEIPWRIDHEGTKVLVSA